MASAIGVDQRYEREMRGVVDENVGRAESLDGRRDDPFAIGRDADVGVYDENVAPHSLDQRRRMRQRFAGSPGDRDVGPLASEGAGDSEADPRPTPGNDRCFACEDTVGGHVTALLTPDADDRVPAKADGAEPVPSRAPATGVRFIGGGALLRRPILRSGPQSNLRFRRLNVRDPNPAEDQRRLGERVPLAIKVSIAAASPLPRSEPPLRRFRPRSDGGATTENTREEPPSSGCDPIVKG